MSFIRKIQNLDEGTKKKWVAALSAVSMILVIAGWLAYMNYQLGANSQNQIEKVGFWQIFKTGLKVSGEALKEKFGNVFSGLGGAKEIRIENR